MKPRNVLAFSIALALAAPVLAQSTGTAKAGRVPKAGPGQPVFMPAGDLKWTDLDPNGAPGVKVADLWGNHAKGAFGAFFKLPAGFAAPLHTHTHAMKVVFISGTYIQAPEGKAEVRLGPGSYMMQPGGMTSSPPARHIAAMISWMNASADGGFARWIATTRLMATSVAAPNLRLSIFPSNVSVSTNAHRTTRRGLTGVEE